MKRRHLHPQDALREAAQRLLTLKMHRISGEPRRVDAMQLNDDLLEIADTIDPVVEAIGHYAAQTLGAVDMRYFTGQLRDALIGNATFEIDRVWRGHAEAAADDAAEQRAALRRGE